VTGKRVGWALMTLVPAHIRVARVTGKVGETKR
jgi:hypothetical protein